MTSNLYKSGKFFSGTRSYRRYKAAGAIIEKDSLLISRHSEIFKEMLKFKKSHQNDVIFSKSQKMMLCICRSHNYKVFISYFALFFKRGVFCPVPKVQPYIRYKSEV